MSAATTSDPIIFRSIEDTGDFYALVIDDVCKNVARQFESYGWDTSDIQNKLKLFRDLWQNELDNTGNTIKYNAVQRTPVNDLNTNNNMNTQHNNNASSSISTANANKNKKRKTQPASNVGIPDATRSNTLNTNKSSAVSYPQYNTNNNNTNDILYNNSQSTGNDNTYQLGQPSDIPINPYENDISNNYNTQYNKNNTIPQNDGANDTSDDDRQHNEYNQSSDNAADQHNNQTNNNTIDSSSFQQYIDSSILNQRTDVDSEILGIQDDDTDDIDEPTDNIILCTYDKVTHVKNKWKVNLTHGIMIIQGRDYMFSKLNGEFDW